MTPIGHEVLLESIGCGCVIRLDESEFQVDLTVLEMRNYDIILGMNGLEAYHGCIDYFVKTITLCTSGQHEVTVPTTRGNKFVEAFLTYIECGVIGDNGVGSICYICCI